VADDVTRRFDPPSDVPEQPETVDDEQPSPVVPTDELPFEERITSIVHSTRLRLAASRRSKRGSRADPSAGRLPLEKDRPPAA
jgi:hypothetical protein